MMRHAREMRGWTQDMLAARCREGGLDISGQSISRLEAKERRIQLDDADVIASVLGIGFSRPMPCPRPHVGEELIMPDEPEPEPGRPGRWDLG
jgi:transcriptional regulator with XRE-family HTH domain